MSLIPLALFVRATLCGLAMCLVPHRMRPIQRDCCVGVGMGALVLGYAAGMALW